MVGVPASIHEIDAKALAGRERDARFSVRPNKAKYSRRFAVDGERSDAGSQAKLPVRGSGAAVALVIGRKGIVTAMATPDARICRRLSSLGLSFSLTAPCACRSCSGSWLVIRFYAAPGLPCLLQLPDISHRADQFVRFRKSGNPLVKPPDAPTDDAAGGSVLFSQWAALRTSSYRLSSPASARRACPATWRRTVPYARRRRCRPFCRRHRR